MSVVAAPSQSPTANLVPLAQATHELTTPEQAADYFARKFKDVDKLIEESKGAIATIEGRRWYQSMFNSDSDDLVRVSRSQNAINDAMLLLIQEVVELNRMGYEFLIKMIHGIDERMRSGWTDTNGSLQKLSSNGQSFAETAKGIFLRIAEGVKLSDHRVAESAARITKLDFSLSLLAGELGDLRTLQLDHDRNIRATHARLQRGFWILAASTGTLAVALAWTIARVLHAA